MVGQRVQDILAQAVRLRPRSAGDDLAEWAASVRHLLQHVLQKDYSWILSHSQDPISDAEHELFKTLLQRRIEGEPVAYLTGFRAFWKANLAVDKSTLIPRPETETLVEAALSVLAQDTNASVLDLGTGSGAIAIALAMERPGARITAVDCCARALEMARANAQEHGVPALRFVHSDWFAAVADQRFDLIVSNPPYIAEDDPHLSQGDVRFEPRTALVSGTDGLDAIRTIVGQSISHLHSAGWLMFEHGSDQAVAVAECLHAAGFVEVSTRQDLEGRDRVTIGQYHMPDQA